MTASLESAWTPMFVGIDVAKTSWDVHLLPSEEAMKLVAGEKGLSQLRTALAPLGSCLVVMEASGGYERELAAELVAAGHRVAVVNPRQVRDFARGLGQLAKTDAIDARILAEFARMVGPRPLDKLPEKQTPSWRVAGSSLSCGRWRRTGLARRPLRRRRRASRAFSTRFANS